MGFLVITVLIADDEDLVRSGLRMILGAQHDIAVVAECADGAEVAELARKHRPTVALLDVRMPGTDGLASLRALRELADPPRTAILTTFDVDHYVTEAVLLGADGFLLKDTDPEHLIAAVRDLARGGAVLDPGVAARLVSAISAGERRAEPARCALDSLTRRQLEVLRLVGEGRSNAQISDQLVLSEATVKGYVSAVLTQIGVSNRVEAALLAYRGGLVA